MKKSICGLHTTNYHNTFIEVGEDCPVLKAQIPPQRGAEKSAAQLQFEMLIQAPYQHTSDDVFFAVFAQKNNIQKRDMEEERIAFFSKGQPCFRASPLTKRYGWGVHADDNGKVAIYPVASAEYKKLAADETLEHVKAMRNKRK